MELGEQTSVSGRRGHLLGGTHDRGAIMARRRAVLVRIAGRGRSHATVAVPLIL